MGSFWSLKSGHTLFLLVGASIAFPVAVNYFYPAYLQYAGGVSILGIFGLVFGMYFNAVIQGPRYPHIEHSIFDSVTGIAYSVKDFFIDYFDPAEKVPDIYSMMKKDDNGKERPVYFGGRWWYPYLVRTFRGISFGEYKSTFLHIFCLPDPWDDFMKFGRRPEGAWFDSEQIDHGTSTHVDSILAPFDTDYVGTKIPIYLCVFARSSVLKITKDWKEDMNEFARYVKNMDELINDVQDSIFPDKELEEVAKEEFPVILKDYGAKRKNGPAK